MKYCFKITLSLSLWVTVILTVIWKRVRACVITTTNVGNIVFVMGYHIRTIRYRYRYGLPLYYGNYGCIISPLIWVISLSLWGTRYVPNRVCTKITQTFYTGYNVRKTVNVMVDYINHVEMVNGIKSVIINSCLPYRAQNWP